MATHFLFLPMTNHCLRIQLIDCWTWQLPIPRSNVLVKGMLKLELTVCCSLDWVSSKLCIGSEPRSPCIPQRSTENLVKNQTNWVPSRQPFTKLCNAATATGHKCKHPCPLMELPMPSRHNCNRSAYAFKAKLCPMILLEPNAITLQQRLQTSFY